MNRSDFYKLHNDFWKLLTDFCEISTEYWAKSGTFRMNSLENSTINNG